MAKLWTTPDFPCGVFALSYKGWHCAQQVMLPPM